MAAAGGAWAKSGSGGAAGSVFVPRKLIAALAKHTGVTKPVFQGFIKGGAIDAATVGPHLQQYKQQLAAKKAANAAMWAANFPANSLMPPGAIPGNAGALLGPPAPTKAQQLQVANIQRAAARRQGIAGAASAAGMTQAAYTKAAAAAGLTPSQAASQGWKPKTTSPASTTTATQAGGPPSPAPVAAHPQTPVAAAPTALPKKTPPSFTGPNNQAAAPAAVPAPAAKAAPVAPPPVQRNYKPVTDPQFEQMHQVQGVRLTRDQIKAVRAYEDGYDLQGNKMDGIYQAVNAHLRGYTINNPVYQKGTSGYQSAIDIGTHLKAAIDQYKIPQDIETYRVLRKSGDSHGTFAKMWPTVKNFYGSLKVGDVAEEKGFLSTTLDKNVAIGGLQGKQHAGVILTIKAPKGTPAVSMRALNPRSPFANSQEMLVNAGQFFRVNKNNYDKKTDTFEVEIELAPPGWKKGDPAW